MMKKMQLSEGSKINRALLTTIVELAIDRGNFVELYDIKKSELEDIFFRPFYLEEDKLFFFNVMSAIYLKEEEFDDEDESLILDFETEFYELHSIVNFLDHESINFERLKIMLSKAEKENISVFSIFYEWFKSTIYYKNGEVYKNESKFRDTWDDIMSHYVE